MSSIVERFISGTYTITRSLGIKYVEGFPVPLGEETVRIRGSMQPLKARELKMVEEGTRISQGWKFYTDAPLLGAGTRSLKKSDIVKILDDTRGEYDTYKVMSTESWHYFDLTYYKSVLVREPEQ